MKDALRELIALAFLSGGALFLCPEGGAKRILSLLCAALLSAAALSPLRELDAEKLLKSESRLAGLESRIAADGRESERLLRRYALEENCARYIRTKAAALGMGELRVELELRQDADGNWLPWALRFIGAADEGSMRELRRMIRDELGIPAERQEWVLDE